MRAEPTPIGTASAPESIVRSRAASAIVALFVLGDI